MIWMVAVAFVVSALIGLPIAFVLGVSGLAHMLVLAQPSLLAMLPQRMFAATDSFSLLAIPLFLFAGELMERSGDVERLADFARALVGHIKGGLAYVTVVLGALLGGPLGSANAEAALLGSTLYREMKRDNYDEVFGTCLVGSVSILGPLIPPGIILIVYGVTAGISIGELFFAGIMPGIYLTLAFALAVYLIGRRQNWPRGERKGLGHLWYTFKRALISLVVPLAVLASIAFGVCTPTEAAAVASVLTFLVGRFVYKNLKLSEMPSLCIKSGILTGAIMLIIAMANILGWTLALDQIPQKVANGLLAISDNPLVFLLLVNLLLLIVGMFLETAAAIIILVPVLLPIVIQLNLDPVHFGLVVCLNLLIGMLTPPVGPVLYTASMSCDVPANRLVGPIWIWVGICIAVLLFVTYFPGAVMFVPRLFFKG